MARGRPLKHQLSFRGLQVVVVVELLAADELLEVGRRSEAVDPELPVDQLGVGVRPFTRDAVDAERAHLAGDVDRAVVHRVAEPRADVAAQDHSTALEHEAGHRPGPAEDDDRAALLVDPGARADLTLDDEVAAAHGGPGQRARVRVDHDDAGHHVLAHRPAHAALDVDLGAVDDAAAEVAETAVEGDLAAGEDADAERVLGARVEDGDVGDALLVEQPAELEVDLARGEILGVEDGPVAVDVGDHRHRVVDLDEAARVVADHPFAGYRVHTITSPS